MAKQHAGPTASGNLALCCVHCNRHKGPNLSGVDIATSQVAPLFNPRLDVWKEHFGWQDTTLIGLTAQRRATIAVLKMNAPSLLTLRAALIASGEFPPP